MEELTTTTVLALARQVGAPWLEAVNVGDVIDSVCLSVGSGELKEARLAEGAGLCLRVPVSSLQSRDDA